MVPWEQQVEGGIKNLLVDILNLRCHLNIQVEMSGWQLDTWVYSSGEKSSLELEIF